MMYMESVYKEAADPDESDELSAFRSKFISGDEKLICPKGNSPGRLPAETKFIYVSACQIRWQVQLF